MLQILLLSLCATSFALPAINALLPTSPTVKIKNGTVIGATQGLVDSFLGVPFAQPPTGSLRLKPPRSITKTYGTFTATSVPTACPQQGGSVVPTSLLPDSVAAIVSSIPALSAATNATSTPQGEDCLTLNVQRPSSATSSSKLPVVFWIYGGGNFSLRA